MFYVTLVSAVMMTSIIWFVQLIQYPGFNYIDSQKFNDYHNLHTNRITFIVAPLMLLELISSFILFFNDSNNPIWFLNLGIVILLWLSTMLISVPLHNQLSRNDLDKKVVDKLVSTNWIRTFLWTLRSFILIYLLWVDKI